LESNVYPFVITVVPDDGSGSPPIVGDFEIPSGFTPNGDRVNDTWMITPIANAQTYSNAVVRVYSKSGQLVFESTGIDEEWDGVFRGSVLPPDVYFFTVDFDNQDAKQVVKGIVTLLR
jgi:gliding motility-associated-like protein